MKNHIGQFLLFLVIHLALRPLRFIIGLVYNAMRSPDDETLEEIEVRGRRDAMRVRLEARADLIRRVEAELHDNRVAPLPAVAIELDTARHYAYLHQCTLAKGTYVNGFIVSTVGGEMQNGVMRNLMLMPWAYETAVFPAVAEGCSCRFHALASKTVKHVGYDNATDALNGHDAFVAALKEGEPLDHVNIGMELSVAMKPQARA